MHSQQTIRAGSGDQNPEEMKVDETTIKQEILKS